MMVRDALASALALVVVLATGCGGPRRLVVELAAPVEMTEERSTGFDPELLEDNGTKMFAGQRLGSPTSLGAYEGIDVLVHGQRIWTLNMPMRAYLILVDGVVVEVSAYGERHSDAAVIETIGREATAGFDAWKEKDPAYWPYIVRDLRVIASTSESGAVKPAGRFVHESGAWATLDAECLGDPSEPQYRIQFRMLAPGRIY